MEAIKILKDQENDHKLVQIDIDEIADAIQWQSGRRQNAGAA